MLIFDPISLCQTQLCSPTSGPASLTLHLCQPNLSLLSARPNGVTQRPLKEVTTYFPRCGGQTLFGKLRYALFETTWQSIFYTSLTRDHSDLARLLLAQS